MIVARSDYPVDQSMIEKIALFCDVAEEAVITAKDVPTIYQVPLVYHEQGLDELVLNMLGLSDGAQDF